MNTTLRSLRQCAALILLCLQIVACDGNPALGRGEERAASDEHRITAEMIEAIKAISLERHPFGTVKRFNQAKSVACLNADFHVPDTLPEELRQGLFAQPGHYRAYIRFANASTSDDRDKDFRGMSIKVFDIGGQSLWGEDGVQDFLLNSYPALFAGTPAEFSDFVQAVRDDALWRFFIKPGNWDSLWIVFNGRERISSPLDIRYWSTTPYRFGPDMSVAVKYSTRPCSTVSGEIPDDPGPDYLRKAVNRHLNKAPACFAFMVQFQGDPEEMPIEDASVIWDESVAPFQEVARITMRDQAFTTDQTLARCERQSFNPWQSLRAHQPIGGINRVRRAVYSELAAFRGEQNQARGVVKKTDGERMTPSPEKQAAEIRP